MIMIIRFFMINNVCITIQIHFSLLFIVKTVYQVKSYIN